MPRQTGQGLGGVASRVRREALPGRNLRRPGVEKSDAGERLPGMRAVRFHTLEVNPDALDVDQHGPLPFVRPGEAYADRKPDVIVAEAFPNTCNHRGG